MKTAMNDIKKEEVFIGKSVEDEEASMPSNITGGF